VERRLPAKAFFQATLDRSAHLYKMLTWIGLLLAAVIYIVGVFGPLFSPLFPPIYLLAAASNASGPTSPHYQPSATGDEETDQLFGMETEPVTDGSLLNKWRRVEAQITSDLEVVAQCQAGKSCPAPAHKLIELSQEGAGRSARARVGVINRAVDLAIRPMSDEKQWGVPDHWSDPLETLHLNSGDCEDYAIVKYAALRAAGLSKDAVKIVVWRNRLPNNDHAVLAVRVDDQWLMLDNRTLTLVRDTDVTRAIPEFVLDDQGVRRFIWSSRIRKATS
jgi:predicted transglutaminase-like cysteine proteinase